MKKELKITLRNQDKDENGKHEFTTYTQQFISLKHVMSWMKLEEEFTQSLVDQLNIMTPVHMLERRIQIIADMFDSDEVTKKSIIEHGNALDKIIKTTERVVIDQYSDGEVDEEKN